MNHCEQLGFKWNQSLIPTHIPKTSINEMLNRFYHNIPQFVYDMCFLEGNPLTLAEVEMVLGGAVLNNQESFDQNQVINTAKAVYHLYELVKTERFALNKHTLCSLHALLAKEEALEWGHFRGEGKEINYTPSVLLGEKGVHIPINTDNGAIALNKQFNTVLETIKHYPPFEQACIFFLSGALEQYFFDGNKRTSRLIMNGVLLSAGMNTISISAEAEAEFNENMVDFYLTKNADKMLIFLCNNYCPYKLSTLIEQCDEQAERDVDVVIWQNDMKPAGKEVW